MSPSVDALCKLSDVELLAAYAESRRKFVEKKFERDTHRARLAWIRAKLFIGSSGGITERNMAADVSEEIARKGQDIREMTRELDLLKVDIEGAEKELFANAHFLERVGCCIVELHKDYALDALESDAGTWNCHVVEPTRENGLKMISIWPI
jgi:hypothetical protein